MKNIHRTGPWILLASFLLSLASCYKHDLPAPYYSAVEKAKCYDCDLLRNNYQDTVDHPTLLGNPIRNAYLLPNMLQAYRNVYHHNPKSPLPVTHLYVKFSPADFYQLDRLEEQDIELSDYPLDRELVSEGDYYQQSGKGIEDIPDYYAVVRAGYAFPAGIAHTVIDEMYIPDNNPVLENEALRLSGNLGNGDAYPPGYYDTKTLKTVPEIPSQATQDSLVLNNDCSHYPSGKVTVQNELLTDHGSRAVRNVKVVIKRNFKEEDTWTNDQGEFQSKKYFKNKYTILLKFKNGFARIARMRSGAIHEQFFPIKLNLGKWDNLDCLHAFNISHPTVTGEIATSQWCAAITHNAIQEFHALCASSHIGTPPKNLNILLSDKRGSGNGNTYMLNKIMKTSTGAYAAEGVSAAALLLLSPFVAGAALVSAEAYKARSPDIKYGYGGDASYLTTDRYTELVYHELGHASQYSAVGNQWWLDFGLAEKKNTGDGFYGGCCSPYSRKIALGEGWAYFIGHYFCDKTWKLQSTPFPEQGDLINVRNLRTYSNISGVSSHICFLESFDPNRFDDNAYWIPKGLLYDLVDPVGEGMGSTIQDNVSGYQPSQFYQAFGKDVVTIVDFKWKLLSLSNNNQKAQVLDLFRQYGY